MFNSQPMDFRGLKTLQLLELLARKSSRSQREFAKELDVSLGMVNAFIKRLVKNGYCTATALPGHRTEYRLTSVGAMEKSRLTHEYITLSYRCFNQARIWLGQFLADLETDGTRRLILYGAGELGRIAWQAVQDTRIRCIAVVDPLRIGEPFAHFFVKNPSRLAINDYDKVLVTVTERCQTAAKAIEKAGVPPEKIQFFG